MKSSVLRFAAIMMTAAIIPMASVHAQAPSATAVHVVTYLDIAPAQMKQAGPLLQKYRVASRAEAGNTGVELFQEIGRSGRIVVRETWADQKSFDGHGKAASATTLEAALKSLQLAPADQRIHLAFAAGNGPAKASGSTVYVFTHVDVPPPRQAELEPLLRQVQSESAKVAPAVRFDVLQQANRKNHFTVVEGWQNRKALDVQATSGTQREFRTKLGAMLGALYDQRLYKLMK